MKAVALRTDTASTSRFEQDVLEGLAAVRKSIPCQWLYDYRGSELFEEITLLPEYYLTRTEIGLLQSHAGEIGRLIGPGATVVEFGSGSSRKTPLLLRAIADLQLYIPVDIAAEFLVSSVQALEAELPGLRSQPVVTDLTDANALREIAQVMPVAGARVGVFLGSSIGNFTYTEAQALLHRFGQLQGPRSWLIIGVDSTRDPNVLVPAYDDARGVTAQFNLNLLHRINQELSGSFAIEQFKHEARFYPDRDRIEMHLVSLTQQRARVAGREFSFQEGESIHTENCHKYAVEQFDAMSRAACWSRVERWSVEDGGFGLYLLRRD